MNHAEADLLARDRELEERAKANFRTITFDQGAFAVSNSSQDEISAGTGCPARSIETGG